MAVLPTLSIKSLNLMPSTFYDMGILKSLRGGHTIDIKFLLTAAIHDP